MDRNTFKIRRRPLRDICWRCLLTTGLLAAVALQLLGFDLYAIGTGFVTSVAWVWVK